MSIFEHLGEFVQTESNGCSLFVDGELTVDDKYKKTLEEVEALKDHLGMDCSDLIV